MARSSVAQDPDIRARQAAELIEIKAALASNCEALTEQLLGEKPSVRSSTDLRFYPHGAFKLTIRGRGRGLWHDHAADKGGDMLALIQHRLGLNFPKAVAWARDYLGMPQPDHSRSMTPEERGRLAGRLVRMKAEAQWKAEADERAQVARQETVSRRAMAVWPRSRPAPDNHPYLAARGVKSHGLRLDPVGRLRIAMQDEQGRIWSFQHIRQHRDGSNLKLFHPGARAKGLFFLIGEIRPGLPIAFAEGYATGASVHEATGLPVVVCFAVSFKAHIMRAWRLKEPDRMLIDAADNDLSKPRNAGAEMAARLRKEIGAIPALPPFQPGDDGKDWNDYHRAHGLDAVREAMREAVRQDMAARRGRRQRAA